jgi:hypothetical protein
MGVKGVDISEDIRELLPTEEPCSAGRSDYASGEAGGSRTGEGVGPEKLYLYGRIG